jgi:hypothetical protein
LIKKEKTAIGHYSSLVDKKKKAISHYDSLVDMVSNGYGTALGKKKNPEKAVTLPHKCTRTLPFEIFCLCWYWRTLPFEIFFFC